ncbi:MAG: coenzyme F420 hydrogenase [Planctomycetes bacterium]|nr:coenzyme F420 hydrogenase [Planctomycetota bacterium]
MKTDVKGFPDLVAEVQEKGICGKCGGCLAFCSAGEFNALAAGPDGTPVMVDESKCLHCGICYLICPQTKALDQELREKSGWKAPIGPQRELVGARAHSPKIRNVATDGGVVTALLTYALRKHLIQAAIVSRRVGPFSREPMLATTPEELLDAAGSHFDESLPVHALGERYTTFSPSVREVKALGTRDLSKVALVGTPCQIFTVRKMRLLHVLPADSIVLTIGLFCMQSFSFGAKARRALEKKLSANLGQIRKLNIKDDVIVTTAKKEAVHIPFEVVEEFARPACFACTDFSNEYADISCGGVGSPDGYTTTLMRTTAGEMLYNRAKEDGAIEELRHRGADQRRNAATEAMAKIVAATRRKQARAADRMRGATC